ncbi:MAG: rhomboid family intramembrane serine protease [Anaerolineae bacterium]|nr:rhomboid family intramembrane serine protease [Anaerolineae bacterium]
MNEPAQPGPSRISYALPLHRPVVTWILLVAVGLMFLVETLTGGSTQTEVLVRLGAKVTPLIAEGQYWRLFTAMFLHIGIVHLGFNGYALLAIGTELERLFDWPRFLAIYFLSGLFGNVASYAFSYNVAAGASGAIFGLIGALAAFFTLHRERLGAWGRARLGNIVFLIAINLFLGFTQAGIDNLAHLGGLVSGFGLGWALAPRYAMDPVHLRVVDRNQLSRYWPALLLALALLLASTVLSTWAHRTSPRMELFQGQQAAEQENWEEAASKLEHALIQDPALADAGAYFYLGLARNQLGQPQLATSAYERALELEPDDSASHWNLALTYMELERYADARQHFESYLALNPDATREVQPYLDQLDRLE